MPRGFWPRDRLSFESRTEEWRNVGLVAELDRRKVQRAQLGVLLGAALLAAVLVVFSQRGQLFPGYGTLARIATVALIAIVGWGLARSLGRAIGPILYRRLEPGTAGTIGFLVRLLAIIAVLIVALRIAGLKPATLAVGGAFTAIVLGLAAQQTIGNLFAGVAMLTARPFRVGERVMLQGGALAGQLEGIVGSLGLYYTTLVTGGDRIMVPNSVMVQLAVSPLHEPERVELRARFPAETTPGELQRMLGESIEVPLRDRPDIAVEEIDHDEVVARIAATPERPADGAELAAEIMEGVRSARGAQDGGDRELAATRS
jgi:small conductance mechanosensitive channel